ncbi:MAG: hypothetical protein C0605_10140 [Hyphomicrobiales bacterium]|nr:MAG: hypothetical protein C0605_10140 [Hyphomicrobiales bacterium]
MIITAIAPRMAGRIAGLAVALAVVWGGLPASASQFTVANVPIKAEAKNAAAAKDIAIAKGQRVAFARLVKRLTRPADAANLPELDKAEFDTLISGFSLSDERPSPRVYRAKLTVRFIARNVSQYFAAYDVPMVESTSTPILVIPVWLTSGGAEIGQGTPWHNAWKGMDLENALVPILLPVGDGTDLPVGPKELLQANSADLAILKDRYNVSGVVVAVARPGQGNAVSAGMKGEIPAGLVAYDNTYPGADGQQQALTKAAGDLIARIEDRWKNETVSLGAGTGEPVNISVPFSGLNEWILIRKNLAAVPGVTNMDIKAMTARGAHVVLTYNGDVRQLAGALAQRNLELTDRGSYWELRPY